MYRKLRHLLCMKERGGAGVGGSGDAAWPTVVCLVLRVGVPLVLGDRTGEE